MINNEINAIKDRICMTIMPKTNLSVWFPLQKIPIMRIAIMTFMLLFPMMPGTKIELSQKAYKSLRGVRKRPVDIVVGYESSFDERAKERYP